MPIRFNWQILWDAATAIFLSCVDKFTDPHCRFPEFESD